MSTDDIEAAVTASKPVTIIPPDYSVGKALIKFFGIVVITVAQLATVIILCQTCLRGCTESNQTEREYIKQGYNKVNGDWYAPNAAK